ncbi:butyrophilin subfamily 1 member A1-like [Rhinatrema bivittatum]|uniref:butyrophilin subfamily 1 member A1-like n=1 Tax=Rhinatrema bivittatum TaxID=194408 RepID=UPI0011271743|nr:butyrophilin subfamily 1 member A1-like [Rhinatrema bivittatum]
MYATLTESVGNWFGSKANLTKHWFRNPRHALESPAYREGAGSCVGVCNVTTGAATAVLKPSSTSSSTGTLGACSLAFPMASVVPERSRSAFIRRCLVDVTLDPETAHPRLLLTDEKTVKYGGTGEDVLVDLLRFDSYLCVLGREAFTSGRHYWEVEVGDGRRWHLGVCRDSVRRKGRITRSPEEGFWAIELRWGGEYWTLTSPRTLLPLSKSPRAVGIFLDYEAEEVSFYDAENKSKLFTFSDPFSDPLLPFFSTLDDSLRIRPVPGWEGECRAQGVSAVVSGIRYQGYQLWYQPPFPL